MLEIDVLSLAETWNILPLTMFSRFLLFSLLNFLEFVSFLFDQLSKWVLNLLSKYEGLVDRIGFFLSCVMFASKETKKIYMAVLFS